MSETIALSVIPLHQIAPLASTLPTTAAHDARWRASGSDPQVQLGWDGEALPGGWYLLSGELSIYRGRMFAPVLYPSYRVRHGGEAERIDLPLNILSGETCRFEIVIRLVESTTRIRFDPSVAPMDFSHSPLQLRRMERGEAMRRLFGASFARRESGVSKLRLLARTAIDVLTKGVRRMADRLYHEYSARMCSGSFSDYEVWQEFYDCRDAAWKEAADSELASLTRRPLVSVIVPTYNTPERWLRRCIESVREQVYPHWELCIADDASTDPAVMRVLAEYAELDERVRFQRREQNGHISAASNTALQMARGEFVALLDHDDELHPLALLKSVQAFENNPHWQMLFTDEDKIDVEGKRSDPYFKSDWNPDLFLSQNCVCHLTVYRAEAVRAVGGFLEGFEGAQDWDLTLRVAEKLPHDAIGHLPFVLYHWRMISGSTAMAPGEKSYAHIAALRAVQAHLDRTGNGGKVLEMASYSGYFRISYPLPEPRPLVSLLIPTRDRIDLLKQCIDSILERTDYPSYEIVVIDNDSQEEASREYFAQVQQDPRVRVLPYPHPFNYSAINNTGARVARGTVLGLLNNDIEVISRDWLDEMVAHALRPEIGVVGAMLYYPNNTIQHAGVILGIGGVAGHCYVGMARGWPGDKHRGGLAQSLSAVTAACAIVRRSVFEQVGGLDEQLEVAFNDVDFCLRVREAGYRNLWTPFAELYHHESASRGYETTPEKIARFKREESFMKARWGRALQQDPYYNLNLTTESTPFTLAYPPRVTV
ncbi:glycosyltransferase family 2 protein [Xanthomonas campestris]|uniref:glycosyltransferase family 2 protein n=1 Tax=Xanthomonas campestris TaxID=339 RepID=UPI000E1F84DE|nr:glycosyltransferase family 2 protein [Xanthomonas campestris]